LRDLTARDFLILMTIGQTGISHPSLAAMVDTIQAKISREALHQRFTVEAVNFMYACLQDVLNHKIDSLTTLKTACLKHFKRVMIVDSTSWDINPKLSGAFPGYGGKASAANCKAQVIYDYKQGELEFFDLTKGTRPDNNYSASLSKQVEPGDLLISDLGYFCLKTFNQIKTKGAWFLSRLLVITALSDPKDGKVIDLKKTLNNQPGNLCELQVIMGGRENSQVKCRLIAWKVPEDVANKRRHKLRKEAAKKGRQPTQFQLTMCAWTIMVTNAPQKVLPAEKIRPLYSLRWQIELLFKQMKSVLTIDHSNTANQNRFRCEVFGKLIMSILIHRIHAYYNIRFWNTNRQELSFDKLYKRIKDIAPVLLFCILQSSSKAIAYLNDKIPLLLKNCCKLKQPSRKSSLESLEFDFGSIHVGKLNDNNNLAA